MVIYIQHEKLYLAYNFRFMYLWHEEILQDLTAK